MTYVLDFGTDGAYATNGGATTARATDTATRTGMAPPIVVSPGTTSWINMWWVTAAANTPSFEFSLTYCEL